MQRDIRLAEWTTLGVGGAAQYFCPVAAEAEIPKALAWCRAQKLPWFALGGGSNLLASDAGYAGLALRVELRGVRDLGGGRVEAAAGEDWDRVVAWCVERELAGVECLSGIPGTVGATPVQNVGAYGQEVATVIEGVRAWDSVDEAWVEFAASECGFGYRASRFNRQDRGRFVIAAVRFRLRPGGEPTLLYPELQRAAPRTLAECRHRVREIRRGKAMLLSPDDPESRSAGSFFKNPAVPQSQADVIAARAGVAPPSFPAAPGTVKIPAAWLIERAGFAKGFRAASGHVGLSSRHVLAIVNYGGATAAEIVALARQVQTQVRDRFGISLEQEPVLVGFDADTTI